MRMGWVGMCHFVGLRQPTVELPLGFNVAAMENEAKLLRWMLAHDPRARPTAAELLARCVQSPFPSSS
jgi:hypothetical protein